LTVACAASLLFCGFVLTHPEAARAQTAAAPQASSPAELFQRAQSWMDKGSFRYAVGDLNRVLRAEPNHVDALVMRGTAYTKLQEYDKAIADLTGAVKLAPQNPAVYEARAVTLDAAGRLTEARADRDQANRMRAGTVPPMPSAPVAQPAKPQPVRAPAPITAGITSPDADPPRPIVPALAPVKASSPAPAPPKVADAGSADTHNPRAREFLARGQYREAIAEFDQAIAAQPDDALSYNGRGYAQLMLHDTRRALADFDQAIRLNPGYINAFQNRAAARKRAGDLAGGAADLAKAKALSR